MHYARLVSAQLIPAPAILTTPAGLITNPKRETYLAHGYKEVIDNPPAATPDTLPAVSSYTETPDSITINYKLVPRPAEIKTYSKLKLVAALVEAHLWSSVRDWLVESDYYDLFFAAQDIRSDHPLFLQALTAAQTRFHQTPTQLATLLAACEAD